MANQVQGTQSFARSIGLLQHICDRSNPPNLRDLLAECAFTRPTLYRLLNSLEAEGLIVQLRDKSYKPGARLINLARSALTTSDIREKAREALVRVRDQTGETVHLAVPSGDGLVYIDKIESLETVRMNSTIGTFVPLHSSGVGKAYLAALSDEKLAAFLDAATLAPITTFTTTNPVKLREQITQCRAEGFVFDSQENETGIACFGAAILDEHALPIAAISISVPLFRLKDDQSHYTAALKECAHRLSGDVI